MTTISDIEDIVSEAASLLGASCEPYTESEHSACTVIVEPDTRVYVEHDRAEARFVLSCLVADVPESARLYIYEMLLQYNFLWPETGGLRMALGSGPGSVVLMGEISTWSLAPARLSVALSNIGKIAEAWRDILSAATTPLGVDPEPSLQSAAASRFIVLA